MFPITQRLSNEAISFEDFFKIGDIIHHCFFPDTSGEEIEIPTFLQNSEAGASELGVEGLIGYIIIP